MYESQVIAILLALFAFNCASCQQRSPPGVPPPNFQQQHYQQPPAPPAPQHYQQPAANAVPMQQQQYQQPAQPHQHQQEVYQQPQAPAHHAQAPHGHHQPQVLHMEDPQHEREHIQEHMEVPIDTSKMSEQELQFHYFKMHDSDRNNKLDGCELIKSLIHWHEEGSKNHAPNEKPQIESKIFGDEELSQLIDPILEVDDTNKDGFIDYPEFVRAQNKAAAQQSTQQNPQATHTGH